MSDDAALVRRDVCLHEEAPSSIPKEALLLLGELKRANQLVDAGELVAT